jgi:hypothetical protein
LAAEGRDVFICHAGADKEEIVKPLVEAFRHAGISSWYDEAEINWGDSITEKVNEGLRVSAYVLVVFSSAFLAKNWPQRELQAALNAGASAGGVRVLPLLAGSEEARDAKRYLPWDGDTEGVVREMLRRLGRKGETPCRTNEVPPPYGASREIPLPAMAKRFTQRDKDMFLKQGFATVAEYFRAALRDLETEYQEVDTDLTEVHKFKFLSTAYVRGEVASRCKIWIGGLTSSDSIAYQCGSVGLDSDDSFNDLLSVTDDGHSLGFEPSHMWLGGDPEGAKTLLAAEDAAKYLWRRFTESLG